MPDLVKALEIRKRLGRDDWGPPRPWGDGDDFAFPARDGLGVVLVSGSYHRGDDGRPVGWLHASISRVDGLPSYDDLVILHRAVWPAGHAYQAFVPPDEHIDIHPRVLHLWGRADGGRIMPNFGEHGTI